MKQETVNAICVVVLLVCIVGTVLLSSQVPPYQ
jgi:hypothetical protein